MTLGQYRKLFVKHPSGSENGAVKFLDEKIADSPHGSEENVVADFGQMMLLLCAMTKGEDNV